MVAEPHRAARLAAVLGQLLECGDPSFAFDSGRVARGQRRDQPLHPIADLKREMGGDGAGKGADVLRGDLLVAAQQARVLGLAHHPPPIFASSARLSISACCATSMASWSPITQTWL